MAWETILGARPVRAFLGALLMGLCWILVGSVLSPLFGKWYVTVMYWGSE